MANEKYKYKFYIVHMAKHGPAHFGQDPKQEAENQARMNEFIKSWSPNLEQVMGLHCYGLAGNWDWIGIFGVTDFSYWVGFREAISRAFPGHISEFLSLPAISHDAFITGTDPSLHYQSLRALGSMPGGAEQA
jgi:hypothetical protein